MKEDTILVAKISFYVVFTGSTLIAAAQGNLSLAIAQFAIMFAVSRILEETGR